MNWKTKTHLLKLIDKDNYTNRVDLRHQIRDIIQCELQTNGTKSLSEIMQLFKVNLNHIREDKGFAFSLFWYLTKVDISKMNLLAASNSAYFCLLYKKHIQKNEF